VDFLRYVLIAALWLMASVQAETIDATATNNGAPVTQYVWRYINGGTNQPTALEACTSVGGTSLGACSNTSGGVCTAYYCNGKNYQVSRYSNGTGCNSGDTLVSGSCINYSCPASGGWTLNGSTCNRPDCASGETRDSNGACVSVCASLAQQPAVSGWYTFDIKDAGPPAGYCGSNNCAVSLALNLSGGEYFYSGTKKTLPMSKSYTGATCTSGSVPEPSTSSPPPPQPKKTPPCLPTEGVLTSSSGTVACVPSGTPAATPPVVRKDSQTTNFPDGSTKIVDTIYTKDPSTGVQSTVQQTTNTPATGGGTGQAGIPGTSTTGSGSSGAVTSGTDPNAEPNSFCKDNPTLDLCTNKLNKEETQQKILEALQGDGDYSSIQNAQADSAKSEYQTSHQAYVDSLTSGSFDSAVSSQKETVAATIGSWWEPVPMSGCNPLSLTIAGRVFNLDPCPTALRISEIASYALWVFLAMGVIGIFAKKGF